MSGGMDPAPANPTAQCLEAERLPAIASGLHSRFESNSCVRVWVLNSPHQASGCLPCHPLARVIDEDPRGSCGIRPNLLDRPGCEPGRLFLPSGGKNLCPHRIAERLNVQRLNV